MRRLLAVLIGTVALLATRSEAATVGPFTNPGNGHDYYVTSGILTWAEAEAWAVGLGGHLVAIESAGESAWLTGNLPLGGDPFWIGARDDANTTDTVFEWVNGAPWEYMNWSPGEPDDDVGVGGNGDYVILSGLTGQWLDSNGNFAWAGGIAEVVPSTSVGGPGGGEAGVRLVVQSLATHDAVAMRFELPAAVATSLRVYDVGGRLVRTLARGALAAGAHELAWDARDEQGSRVGAALYFVSLQAGEARRSARVVIAR